MKKPIERRVEALEARLGPDPVMPEGLGPEAQVLWGLTTGGFTLSELVTESMRLEAANDQS